MDTGTEQVRACRPRALVGNSAGMTPPREGTNPMYTGCATDAYVPGLFHGEVMAAGAGGLGNQVHEVHHARVAYTQQSVANQWTIEHKTE